MAALPPGSTLPPPQPPAVDALSRPAPGVSMARARVVLLALAVALAFADASIVVLALPDLYAEFDTSVVGVSWVLTAYAIVVTVAAAVAALASRRLRPALLTGVGLAVFAAASLGAGLAGSFPVLLVARCAQGVGAALLLAGALPVLGFLTGAASRGRSWWAWAGTIGAAIGPALGGVLTQLLDWRAIFVVQAPVAAVALVALVAPAVRRLPPVRAAGPSRSSLVANLGYVLVFAALVGALFLSVLLVVEVWRFQPVAGALVVTALPAGTLLARPLGARLGAPAAAVGGAVLLGGGLVGLAVLPGSAPWLAAAALVACGMGFGLSGDVLGPVAIPATAEPVRAGSLSTAARHAGIVLGLVVLAPMLAADLDRGADEAVLLGTATMLDGRVEITEKVPLALALRDEIEATPAGEVPDLGAVFDARGADSDAALAAVRDDLIGVIERGLTRAFRPAFFAAAALAVAGLAAALAVAGRQRGRRTSPAGAGLLAVAVVGMVAVGAAGLSRGSWDQGRYVAADPCTASPDPYPVGGLDGFAQNAALGALNGAACELGVSREVLVLSIDPESGFSDVRWDTPTVERAVRAGLVRSVDDLEERGSLPGPAAWVLKELAERAPVEWVLDRLGVTIS